MIISAPQNLPRKPPGSGGSGIINMRRNSETQLLTSKADYTKAFNLWTNYVLGSLDWTNVIVAGEFPLVSDLSLIQFLFFTCPNLLVPWFIS